MTAKIEMSGVFKSFGPKKVLQGLSLDVNPRESVVVIGGSGTGKSVLLRAIIGLLTPAEGEIEVFGERLNQLSDADRRQIEQRWGVAFQDGALFSSLTVLQNVMAPLREHTRLSEGLMRALGGLKIRNATVRSRYGLSLPGSVSVPR